MKANLASTVLSADGTSVVQTFTQSATQAQLTQALAQAQLQLAQQTTQMANSNALIASIQAQLALFPVQVTPPANP